MERKKLILLFIVSLFLFGVSSGLGKLRAKTTWDGNQYSLENLNTLDRHFAHPYTEQFDDFGDILVGLVLLVTVTVCFAIPGITALKNKQSLKSVFLDCFVYFETMICGIAVFRILKVLAGRVRPYMYFANPSQKGIAKGDFIRSWPSGHTSVVFLSFAFFFWWIHSQNFKPLTKRLLSLVGLVLCLETGYFRVLSGNHFPTDVLTGILLGLSVGTVMFKLTNKIINKR